jgi:hypothetical protein
VSCTMATVIDSGGSVDLFDCAILIRSLCRLVPSTGGLGPSSNINGRGIFQRSVKGVYKRYPLTRRDCI